jgi:hypothetical protein
MCRVRGCSNPAKVCWIPAKGLWSLLEVIGRFWPSPAIARHYFFPYKPNTKKKLLVEIIFLKNDFAKIIFQPKTF